MGVKKSTRAKKPAAKATAKRLTEKAASLRSRMKLTKAMGAGFAFAAVVVVAGVVMFAGRDSAEQAEAAAVAADDSAAATPASVSQVRAIAGVPAKTKKTSPKPEATDSGKSAAAPKTAGDLPETVTIEGCLEQNGDSFRLKNTTGEDAPKSRSWKSGFLKKGARPVDVVDWNSRLKGHVGERVSVSGMFVDGEMRVRTLRRLAATCN